MSDSPSCPPHHWLFEEPNGPVVHGICKQCGEHTERVTAPQAAWMNQAGNESRAIGPGRNRHRAAFSVDAA